MAVKNNVQNQTYNNNNVLKRTVLGISQDFKYYKVENESDFLKARVVLKLAMLTLKYYSLV